VYLPPSNPAPDPGSTPSNQQEQVPADTTPAPGNVSAPAPSVFLYLKDGTEYTATDYWLADNELHYVVNDGEEHRIHIAQLDFQRTVDENANRGVTLSLKPNPDSSNSRPEAPRG
jgi:hypothetical protein